MLDAVVPHRNENDLHVLSPDSDDQNYAAVNRLNLSGDEGVYSEGDGAEVRMFIEATPAIPK